MFAISYPIWNIGRTGILEDFLSHGGLHVSIFSSLGFFGLSIVSYVYLMIHSYRYNLDHPINIGDY